MVTRTRYQRSRRLGASADGPPATKSIESSSSETRVQPSGPQILTAWTFLAATGGASATRASSAAQRMIGKGLCIAVPLLISPQIQAPAAIGSSVRCKRTRDPHRLPAIQRALEPNEDGPAFEEHHVLSDLEVV